MALFPFRNPITDATGCFGGMAMHICTGSGIRCPSTIWHSFCFAKAWKIAPHCWRMFPKISFRRPFGNEDHEDHLILAVPTWSGLGFGKDPTLDPPSVGH